MKLRYKICFLLAIKLLNINQFFFVSALLSSDFSMQVYYGANSENRLHGSVFFKGVEMLTRKN